MTKILTKRKQAWVNNHNPALLRGKPLNPNASIAIRYYERLYRLIDHMTKDVEAKTRALFSKPFAEEFFAEDDSISSQARILTNELTRKYNRLFAGIAKSLATQMVEQSNKASSTSVHTSLKELSGGMSLGTRVLDADMEEVLSASVTESVGLIKSIPEKYLQGVQGAVMRSITTGNGLHDLVPYLQKHRAITDRRARMIAHDQSRKAFNAMNKARMQKLGVEEFEWLHTGGSAHPRKLHQRMSGNVYKFSEPPIIDEDTGERGIPGQAINCRCRMVPVIKFGE